MQEKYNEFLLNLLNSRNESEFFEKIKKFLETNEIEASVRFILNGKKIEIKPFHDIKIKNSLLTDKEVEVKGEKELENILNMAFFYMKSKIEREREESLKKKIEKILKDETIEVDEIEELLAEKKLISSEEDYFFKLVEKISKSYKELKEQKNKVSGLLDLLLFLFFKIIKTDIKEHIREVILFSLKKTIPDFKDFFFLLIEEKGEPPVDTILSSPFIDEFFYEELWRERIEKEEKKINYRGKILTLFYSTLFKNEKGVFGILTEKEIIEPEIINFLDFLSHSILFFLLKEKLSSSFYFVRNNLPILYLKISLLKRKIDENLIQTLDKELENIDINKLIKDTLKTLDPEIVRKKINVILKEKEKISVPGDEILLKLAFLNLFRHIIVFNRIKGYIKIEFEKNKLSIEDSGIGLTELEKISILDPQNIDNPLDLAGLILNTHRFFIDINVERGIGNKFVIFF